MIKKYISQSTTIEVNDFYGGDEIITSLEDTPTSLRIITNKDVHLLPLQVGDYLLFEDGSSKVVTHKPITYGEGN